MVYRKTAKVESQLAGKRQRILQAARHLVVEGGFSEAPIAAIARISGVATGTVYRHFGSKSELLAEVVDGVSQHELDVIAAEAGTEGTAAQRLERAIRLFCSRALQGRRLAYALMAEPLDPEIDEIRLLYRCRFGSIYETLIDQGIRAHEFPKQHAATSAACIVGACIEALIGPVSLPEGASKRKRNELIQDIVTFNLAAIRAPRLEHPAGQTTRKPPPHTGASATITQRSGTTARSPKAIKTTPATASSQRIQPLRERNPPAADITAA